MPPPVADGYSRSFGTHQVDIWPYGVPDVEPSVIVIWFAVVEVAVQYQRPATRTQLAGRLVVGQFVIPSSLSLKARSH
jgi:hypothetical protein